MAKLTEYPAATQFDSGDILIKDGTNGTKKITAENAAADLVSKAVDTTLTQPGKAADAAAVGAELSNLKSDVTLFNSFNYLKAPLKGKTSGGITWTKVHGAKLTVEGTATSTSLYDIIINALPDWIVPGQKYHVEYSSTNVDFRIYASNQNSTSTKVLDTKTSADFVIPSDAVSVIIRYVVSSGKTVDETVEAIILNAESNKQLSEQYNTLNTNVASNTSDIDALKDSNPMNLLNSYRFTEKTAGGITWQIGNDGLISVSGNATSTAINNYTNGAVTLPYGGLEAGVTYKLFYKSENVFFRLLWTPDSDTPFVNILETLTDCEFTIPANSSQIYLRLAVTSGTANVNETVKPVLVRANSDAVRLSDIVLPNNFDLLQYATRTNKTSGGMTYEWLSDGSCHVSGSISSTSFSDLYNGTFPNWLTRGATYFLKFSGQHVRFLIYIKRTSDSSFARVFDSRTNDRVVLPVEVHSILIRIAVWADEGIDVSVNEIVKPELFVEKPDNLVTRDFKKLVDDNLGYPQYYEQELADTVSKIKIAMSEPCLAFIWCTDIHYQSSITQTMISDDITWMCATMRELTKRLRLDGLICTGDLIDAKPPLTRADIEKQSDYVMQNLHTVGLPIIFSLGNHDDNRYIGKEDEQELDPFTSGELYGRYLSFVDPRNIPDYDSNGRNYYLDFDKYKIRMLVLDSNYWTGTTWNYGFSSSTLNWFSEQLNNIPSDWSVIVVCHMSPIKEHNADNINYNNFVETTNEIQSFIDGGGNYICTLYGHSHVDYYDYHPWLEITMACAKASYVDPDGQFLPTGATAPVRTAGTVTEQLYDIIIIKPSSKEIQTIRFGAGNDRVWSYDT